MSWSPPGWPCSGSTAGTMLEVLGAVLDSQDKTDMAVLQQVQQWATRIIGGLEYLPPEAWLRELGQFSIEEGRLRGTFSMGIERNT